MVNPPPYPGVSLDSPNIGSNNRLYTKLYNKRDDFDFPSSPSYGVHILQLVRYGGAAYNMMNLDIGINFWLSDSCLRAVK